MCSNSSMEITRSNVAGANSWSTTSPVMTVRLVRFLEVAMLSMCNF
jgi:hypothetical protein